MRLLLVLLGLACLCQAQTDSVTHMVVVTKGKGGAAAAGAGAGALPNPNEPSSFSPATPPVPQSASPSPGEFKPLMKTMSEGRLLRKLWAEMNQIEALIHAANIDLKARLIKAFKVVRTRMVEWEKLRNDDSAKKTEGARLRAQWAAMGAIEDEIHEINVAMKKRLQGLIQALRSKMHIFDAAAERIDRMRKANGKPPGMVASSAAAAANAAPVQNNGQGNVPEGPAPAPVAPKAPAASPCPPGEVAIAGKDGAVGCSVQPTKEKSVSNVPAWRRHLEPGFKSAGEDALSTLDQMGPLVKTVSEGAKLRALWAELGGIEQEIHETNLVLKARLLAAFKVIRARMANWEKEGNPDKRRSEGARLRAQWAELGHVEEQIHITNQEMKRRLRRVIRVIKTKMKHFEGGAQQAKQLSKVVNPAKPGRQSVRVPTDSA